jgi:MFS family permease
MSVYGISIAAAHLVGFGASGAMFSGLGPDWLFFFGTAMLVCGAGLSVLLPSGRREVLVSPAPSGGGFGVVKALVRRRGLTVAYVSVFAQYFSFGGVVTLLPVYVSDIGMDAFHVGMLLTVFSVTFIAIQFPSGMLSDRAGRRLPIIAGLSIGIAALVLLPVPAVFPQLAAVIAFYGLAYGLLFPSISALVADHSRPDERGVATGIFHALLTAGVAIGAPVMGGIGEAVGVRTSLMLTSVAMALALGVVMLVFPQGRR